MRVSIMLSLIVAGLIGVFVTGCESLSGKQAGTLTGAAAGALVAGDDDRLAGALIGAAVGGGSGYLVGSQLDKKKQRNVCDHRFGKLIMT